MLRFELRSHAQKEEVARSDAVYVITNPSQSMGSSVSRADHAVRWLPPG